MKGWRRIALKPKPVVRRWINQKAQRWAIALARAHMRKRLPRLERERKQALLSAFNTTRRYALKFDKGPFPATSTLFNIGLYLLIAERDIQSLKIEALTHPDEWTRKLHARMILLIMYEWNADKVTGQALRDAMKQIDAPEALKQDAIEALRSLRSVREKIQSQFIFMRNAAIAHRDPDALSQLQAIETLKVEDVMTLGTEFFAAINNFMPVLTRLVEASNSFAVFIRQWSSREPPEI